MTADATVERITATCYDAGYRACIEDLKDYNGPGLVTNEMVAYLEAIFKKARAE